MGTAVKQVYSAQQGDFINLLAGPASKRLSCQEISTLCSLHQIQTHYENTYRLEPKTGVPNTDKLSKVLKNVIQSEIGDFSGRYSSFTAKYYSRLIADTIKNEMKDRVDPRYKITVFVHIGENNGQDLTMKSSYLWDSSRDR